MNEFERNLALLMGAIHAVGEGLDQMVEVLPRETAGGYALWDLRGQVQCELDSAFRRLVELREGFDAAVAEKALSIGGALAQFRDIEARRR